MASLGQRYKNKVVIITGGSRGIGKGILREGKQEEDRLNGEGPGEASFVFCDVTREDEIKVLISNTVEKYGRIDCLVNNAGTHPGFTNTDELSGDDFRCLLYLNLVGYFLTAKYALPYLRKTQGNIVNVSSLVAEVGQANAVSYVATKGGITAMTKAMAVDEAKYDVRVNSISPSGVWTPLFEYVAKKSGDPEGLKRRCADLSLFRRYGTLEECGQACLYLAAEGTFCTGIDLRLSGGSELNYGYNNVLPKSTLSC